MAGQVGNPADKPGIEKASVSGLGLIRLDLKGCDCSKTVVQGRGGSMETSQRQDGDKDGISHEPHLTLHEHPA